MNNKLFLQSHSLVIGQVERQDVGIGNHQIVLLQRIIAQGAGRGQHAGHPPHPLVRDKAARLVNPLSFAHLLRLMVKGQGDGVPARVTHHAPRVAHIRHHQTRSLGYRYQCCGARKRGLQKINCEKFKIGLNGSVVNGSEPVCVCVALSIYSGYLFAFECSSL